MSKSNLEIRLSRSSTTLDCNISVPQPVRDLEPNKEANDDPFVVTFDDADPANPKNWSRRRRWYLTLASGLLVLNATFASSAPAGIVPQLISEFGMSEKLGVLTLSLFVAGYCVGPLLWAPLSEQYGRRPIFLLGFVVYTAFQVGAALAPNTASMLVFRFLGGVFAAAPLTNSGALISDIWDAGTRGKALAIFTAAPFAGPALGPTVSGFIGEVTSWRWVFWTLAIFAGLCCFLILFTIPETYSPIILVEKAKKKRKETGDGRFYAPMEKTISSSTMQRVEDVLARPFMVMFSEPMLIALALYISFVYGCIYLLFQAYPVVFTQGHHFGPGVSGLMFLPIPIGGVLAVLLYVLIYNPRYEREVARCAPHPVPPEFRLEMTLIAGPLLAISFFWFAWTSYPNISFWVPMSAGLLMGFSICWIFLSLINYIIDAYLSIAASALASNTVIRSLCGAAFPLFTTEMYANLGPQWASSLVGFIALALVPIPFVLQKFGPTLRKKSKYAPTQNDSPDSEKIESPAV